VECNSKDFSVSLMANKTVLELGSGCGLAGISLMLKGADVTFTDLQVVTSKLTSLNVFKIYNHFIGKGSIGSVKYILPKVTSIDWTKHESPEIDDALILSYDFILLTDCVFSKALVPDLVSTLLKYSTVKTEIICCHEIRDEVQILSLEKRKFNHAVLRTPIMRLWRSLGNTTR
jgi:predicted nicotinamide N-methyase